jgi:ribosomal-protein-alanine N-acetyltransferase
MDAARAVAAAARSVTDPGATVIFDRDIRNRVSVPQPAPPRAVPATIEVGPVRWHELTAVARLQRRAFRPPLAYGLTTLIVLRALPHVHFLVARRGDDVVGCAIGDRSDGTTRVINLAVDPGARRQGVGTALLRALEADLPRGNILLMVEAENLAAQALYRREGYLPVGNAADYYGRGRSGIWMQKQRGGASEGPKLRV